MARSTPHDWFSLRSPALHRPGQQRPTRRQPFHRRLRLEPLEDRRLLAVVTVNTLVDTVDLNDGVTSLREAIFATNTVAGADTIEFAASLTSAGPATITLTQGELAITDSLTVSGPGANLLTIDASGNDPTPESTLDDGDATNDGDGSRIFNIDNANSTNLLDVSISGLTLTGGDDQSGNTVRDGGGAIRSLENLTVIDSTISGNSASAGGGIHALYGKTTVIDSTISGNSAPFRSGGISVRGGNLTVTGSTISGNSGGGIATSYGNLVLNSSTISGNSSAGSGGGVFLYVAGATVSGSTINGNSAGGNGGGIATFYFSNLTLTSSTISGNSAGFDGGGIFSNGFNGNLTVTGSAISGNSATNNGGGIFTGRYSGNATVANSTISNNSAGLDGGGISSVSLRAMAVTGSTISDNSASRDGGGIFSRVATPTVTGSTISGNSATRGGGIYSRNGLTVGGSTISGNSADASGGGIFHGGYSGNVSVANSTISGNSAGLDGGGIYNRFTSLTVDGSTISGNRASGSAGGVYLLGTGQAAFTIRHTTITANSASNVGGGMTIFGGTLSLDHSIVAANFAALGQDLATLFGTVVAATYSLIGSNAGSPLVESSMGSPDANGNLVGGLAGGAINPLLGALADNGGTTWTHELLAGSPANNAGNPSAFVGIGTVPAFDQRGAPFERLFGGRIDIGAYERQALPGLSLVVDTLADENDGQYSAGDLSLREAIGLANGSIGPDTITFAAALTTSGPATIVLKRGELRILDDVVINGPDAELLTVDASGNDPTPHSTFDDGNTKNDGDGSRLFNVDDGSFSTRIDVSITGLTLTGGDIGGGRDGGAILSFENLAVTGSAISGNLASEGGGIYIRGASLTITASTISGNSARGDGGAIRTGSNSQVLVTNSSLSGNSAKIDGGAISNSSSSVTIINSALNDNLANGSSSSDGGAIWMSGGSLTVTDSTISNNSAPSGGGISCSSGTVTVIGSTFSGNSATGILSTNGKGGGILGSFNLTVIHSTFSGNSASNNGGGLFVTFGSTVVTHSIVANNSRGAAATPSDIFGNVTLLNSLLGVDTGATITNNGGNFIGTAAAPIDPLLGPLAENGGPTMTHALLTGSPAIDAGHPDAMAGVLNVPQYDQRGEPFTRVFGGRIDIGAFELQVQPLPAAFFGDYNQDGNTDAGDYVVWRKTLGGNVAPYSGADGNGNGIVDQGDYGVWRAHFGQTIGAGSGATTAALSNGTSALPSSASVGDELARDSSMDRDAGGQTTSAYVPIAPAVMALVTPAATHQLVAARSAAETVTARRDDALVAWLASQRETTEPFDDLDAIQPREHDGPSRADGVTIDFVDECFALLADD